MTVLERQATSPADDAVVRLAALTKTFGDQKALDAVDLTLRHGEVTALIGENGSGKSTLIKCLTGVYQPDARGQLSWGTHGSPEGCVVVHQDLGLIPGLTVAENFGVGLGFQRDPLGRVRWKRHNEHVQKVLDDAGVMVSAKTKIEDLSLAQQTNVAIARGLSQSEHEVSLVILDEPTAALPLDERAQVLDTVRSLREQGMAVLYVSHHLDEIVEIGDRVVVLRAGQVAHDRPGAGLETADLLTLMSGEVAISSDHDASLSSTEELLTVRGLTTDRLLGIDLTLHRGEILGLVGALDSGAGDICRAIAGALPYEGEVALNGSLLSPGSIRERVRRGIFLVPSDRRGQGIIGTLDVTENLQLAAQRRQFPLARISRRAEKLDVERAMESLDIRPRDPRRKVGMLSGGNQQKVVLARCLAQQPVVMVLENPTQGVDPAARLQIRAAIRKAASEGLTVVVSDVDEAEISALAHRVLHLDSGQVLDLTV